MALRRPDVLCPQRVWNDSQGYAFLYLLHNVGDDGVAVADGGQRLDLDWVEAQLTVNGGHHTGKVYRQGFAQPLAAGGVDRLEELGFLPPAPQLLRLAPQQLRPGLRLLVDGVAETGDRTLLLQVAVDDASGGILPAQPLPLHQFVRPVDHLRRRARRAGDGAVGEDASGHAGYGRFWVGGGYEAGGAGRRADELLVHRHLQRELPDSRLLLGGQLAPQQQPHRLRVGELLHDLLQGVAADPDAASLGAA